MFAFELEDGEALGSVLGSNGSCVCVCLRLLLLQKQMAKLKCVCGCVGKQSGRMFVNWCVIKSLTLYNLCVGCGFWWQNVIAIRREAGRRKGFSNYCFIITSGLSVSWLDIQMGSYVGSVTQNI